MTIALGLQLVVALIADLPALEAALVNLFVSRGTAAPPPIAPGIVAEDAADVARLGG